MEDEKINRAYLETLSFSDLVKLADEYGVDVPEDLDRRFLISELLEIVEEFRQDRQSSMHISSEDAGTNNTNLPKSYNETQISCVLRSPVWAFVFWDISETDLSMLKSLHDYSLSLRVCILESTSDLAPVESFEIDIAYGINEQYLLIPAGKKNIRIELVYTSGTTREVLAFSPVVALPENSAFVENFEPGIKTDFSEIAKLSGIEEILMEQYKNYRHSFS